MATLVPGTTEYEIARKRGMIRLNRAQVAANEANADADSLVGMGRDLAVGALGGRTVAPPVAPLETLNAGQGRGLLRPDLAPKRDASFFGPQDYGMGDFSRPTTEQTRPEDIVGPMPLNFAANKGGRFMASGPAANMEGRIDTPADVETRNLADRDRLASIRGLVNSQASNPKQYQDALRRLDVMTGPNAMTGDPRGRAVAQARLDRLAEAEANRGNALEMTRAAAVGEAAKESARAAAPVEAARVAGELDLAKEQRQLDAQERVTQAGIDTSRFAEEMKNKRDEHERISYLIAEAEKANAKPQDLLDAYNYATRTISTGGLSNDLNRDGKVSPKENEYNNVVRAIKGKTFANDPAGLKRLNDRKKELEADPELFPGANAKV